MKAAKNNVKRRMAEAPVDLKQPRPKRNRRPTQKVTDNEKQQHEKKKLKTLKPPSIEDLDDDANQPAVAGLVSCPEKNSPMKLPPSAALRLKNQSPYRRVREGQ